ncbi:hypothetical protein CBOM_00432 [Ceraceosorus bombacis]|uniref:Uncharacterized protein n=1 Tax=Ceraceosorus bombacis TaxID=401625 RepID=A0A0P1B9E2_9BASI|nr:hypothetical protein CBOM_00432 [Ceraceosorus bombacis]
MGRKTQGHYDDLLLDKIKSMFYRTSESSDAGSIDSRAEELYAVRHGETFSVADVLTRNNRRRPHPESRKYTFEDFVEDLNADSSTSLSWMDSFIFATAQGARAREVDPSRAFDPIPSARPTRLRRIDRPRDSAPDFPSESAAIPAEREEDSVSELLFGLESDEIDDLPAPINPTTPSQQVAARYRRMRAAREPRNQVAFPRARPAELEVSTSLTQAHDDALHPDRGLAARTAAVRASVARVSALRDRTSRGDGSTGNSSASGVPQISTTAADTLAVGAISEDSRAISAMDAGDIHFVQSVLPNRWFTDHEFRRRWFAMPGSSIGSLLWTRIFTLRADAASSLNRPTANRSRLRSRSDYCQALWDSARFVLFWPADATVLIRASHWGDLVSPNQFVTTASLVWSMVSRAMTMLDPSELGLLAENDQHALLEGLKDYLAFLRILKEGADTGATESNIFQRLKEFGLELPEGHLAASTEPRAIAPLPARARANEGPTFHFGGAAA